jgi:hypothetical protein
MSVTVEDIVAAHGHIACYIRRVTTTRPIFIACTGFFRTISYGSRDAE